jgi:hypothetical protein
MKEMEAFQQELKVRHARLREQLKQQQATELQVLKQRLSQEKLRFQQQQKADAPRLEQRVATVRLELQNKQKAEMNELLEDIKKANDRPAGQAKLVDAPPTPLHTSTK